MKNKIKIGLIVGICALMLACGNSGKSGKVVFETEDKKIKVYESEVNYELKRNLEATGLSEKDISAEQLEQMKIQIVQNIAMTRAIALEGKNQNLDKSKNYLDGIETTKESLLASVTVAERSKNTEVTEEKLEIVRDSDYILREVIRERGLEGEIWQYFTCLPDIRSVGVMGDVRTYDYTVVVRAVTSIDGMTASWAKIPFEVLEEISARIVNEVAHVNRVVYDITSKPPATIEWE